MKWIEYKNKKPTNEECEYLILLRDWECLELVDKGHYSKKKGFYNFDDEGEINYIENEEVELWCKVELPKAKTIDKE